MTQMISVELVGYFLLKHIFTRFYRATHGFPLISWNDLSRDKFPVKRAIWWHSQSKNDQIGLLSELQIKQRALPRTKRKGHVLVHSIVVSNVKQQIKRVTIWKKSIEISLFLKTSQKEILVFICSSSSEQENFLNKILNYLIT